MHGQGLLKINLSDIFNKRQRCRRSGVLFSILQNSKIPVSYRSFVIVKKLCLLFLVLLGGSGLYAQETPLQQIPISEDAEANASPKIYTVVERMPEFPGGDSEMYSFISKNLKYPTEAKDQNISGIVYVQFVVSKTGVIDDNSVRILRSVHELLDEATENVVKSFPNWTPGYQNQKPVAVYYNLPVRFMLDAPNVEDKKRNGK